MNEGKKLLMGAVLMLTGFIVIIISIKMTYNVIGWAAMIKGSFWLVLEQSPAEAAKIFGVTIVGALMYGFGSVIAKGVKA